MKINKFAFGHFLFIASMAVLYTACEKTTGFNIIQTTDDSQTQSIIAADELNVNNEFDQAVNEALLACSISSTSCGAPPLVTTGNILFNTINGAVIDTNQINNGLIKITYYGKTPDGLKGRTGEIEIQLAMDNGHVIPWKTQGTTAQITFTKYEVIELATNKSLWLDGPCTITNVSGGLLRNLDNSLLAPGDSLVDRARAHITFTYNDNVAIIVTWTWDLSQHRVFSLSENSSMSSWITGDTLMNDVEGVSTWGDTRSGENFYSAVSTPVIQSIPESFMLSNPLDGVKTINSIAEPMTNFYGVDDQGNPINNQDPYGYKVTWYRAGPQQVVIKY